MINYLDGLNKLRPNLSVRELKWALPEGYLQRRLINTNYKVLQHIIYQRHDHRLSDWQVLCEELNSQLNHPELIFKENM